jgi:LysM repeat protein
LFAGPAVWFAAPGGKARFFAGPRAQTFASGANVWHSAPMPRRLSLMPVFSGALLMACVTSCSNMGSTSSGSSPSGTGPFDSRGNYVEAWADNPAKWRGGSRLPTPTTTTPTPSEPTPPPVVATTTPRPTATTQTASRPATPKPKPKPAAKRYTVKKGDTLSRIASRNGTSVAALRRANGISGDLIRPGQVLKLP